MDGVGEYTGPLAELRWHYGEAYIINCTGLGRWTAERRDTREVLRSDSAAGLVELIRSDYAARPVARLPVITRYPAGHRRRTRPAPGAAAPAEPGGLIDAGQRHKFDIPECPTSSAPYTYGRRVQTALIAAYTAPAGFSMITWPGTRVCAKAHTPVVP
jgi:hypothetical protein